MAETISESLILAAGLLLALRLVLDALSPELLPPRLLQPVVAKAARKASARWNLCMS